MPDRARIVTVAGLVCLAVIACGDSGLSKQEFIRRADAICREANERTERLEPPSNPQEREEFIKQARSITDEAIADLRALDPPEEDRDRIDRMLDKLDAAVGYLPEIQDASEEQDLERMEELARKIGNAAGEAEEIARDYGLEACSSEEVVPSR